MILLLNVQFIAFMAFILTTQKQQLEEEEIGRIGGKIKEKISHSMS